MALSQASCAHFISPREGFGFHSLREEHRASQAEMPFSTASSAVLPN